MTTVLRCINKTSIQGQMFPNQQIGLIKINLQTLAIRTTNHGKGTKQPQASIEIMKLRKTGGYEHGS